MRAFSRRSPDEAFPSCLFGFASIIGRRKARLLRLSDERGQGGEDSPRAAKRGPRRLHEPLDDEGEGVESGGIRTLDPALKRRVLYQLSYGLATSDFTILPLTAKPAKAATEPISACFRGRSYPRRHPLSPGQV